MERRRGGRPRHPDILTPAEWGVLRELRAGGTNAEIAVRLGVSPDAVKYHISNMLGKLGLEDRHALATWQGEAVSARQRLRALLASPAALASLASLGRPLAWVGAGVAGAIIVAVAAVVLVAVLGGDGADVRLFATAEPVVQGGALTVEVSAGNHHTCALQASGEVVCWGANRAGQTDVPSGEYRSVSAGASHTCAVRESGEVVCWGAYGRRPDGRSRLGSYRSVSAGASHTCAVRESGEIDCWGANGFGEVDAPAGRYHSVSAGPLYTCAVRESDEIVCWGWNEQGQTDAPSGRYRAVSAGATYACAIRESGEVDCWGFNFGSMMECASGELPLRECWLQQHTCAVRESGALFCWGFVEDGMTDAPDGKLPLRERGP